MKAILLGTIATIFYGSPFLLFYMAYKNEEHAKTLFNIFYVVAALWLIGHITAHYGEIPL